MNANAGKQRSKGGRPGAPNKRGRQFDKSVMNEGVYANPRMVHATLLLVGCNVQVTVKNGGIYEGILKTISPSKASTPFSSQSHIVLDVAHKVDPANSGKSFIPTHNMLINSIIFNPADVVTITGLNVEMDYANKDSFTDSAISKFNNGDNSSEKELQPWDGGGGGPDGDLDSLEKPSASSSANGWDAEDMFNVNEKKFRVESSYDPNLSQYTTPLVKRDTKEYRDKEAQAARLAQEIEKSEDYGKRTALENGDGDDEELAFSAVIRSNPETNNNSSGVAKYVPPHQRKPQQPGGRPTRMVGNQGGPGSGSPSPSPQQPSPSRNMTAPGLVPHNAPRPSHPGSASSVSVSVSAVSSDNGQDDSSGNKNEDDRRSSEPDRGNSSERTGPSHTNPQQIPLEKRPPNTNRTAREGKIQELVNFKNQFKLKESIGKEPPHERKLSQPQQQTSLSSSTSSSSTSQAQHPQPSQPPTSIGPPHQSQGHMAPPLQAPSQHPSEGGRPGGPAGHPSNTVNPQIQSQAVTEKTTVATPSSAVASASVVEKKEEEKKEAESEEKDKKSTLNPFAKEFVPGGLKTQRPQHPAPNSTPPRAATQSPVVNIPLQHSHVYYHIPTQNPAAVLQNQQAPRLNSKKAVVSARPDLNAAAATGQPLLQNPMVQNTSYTMHHPSGYNFQLANAPPQGSIPQVFQQMVMPSNNPRMVTPSLLQGPTTPTDPVAYQNQQPFFVSPQGPPNAMQPYIGPPPSAGASGTAQQGPPAHSVAMPVHMTAHPHATPPHSQTANHMSSQGGASGAHPNPSPVPQPGPAGHPHPQQGHPPSSGTPQPGHVLYQSQGNPQQPGHPPLQPSPHTPTSPIYQQQPASLPVAYTPSYTMVQAHMTTGAPQHTTVTNAPHTQHSHAPGHGGQPVIMMTQQLQHAAHHHGHNQAVNQQMSHNHAAMAASAGGPHPNPQYAMNPAGQHPQAHQVQGRSGGHLHGQAGTGLPMNVPYQHPQMGPPFHHNQ